MGAMEATKLVVDAREDRGTCRARRLRRAGTIPGIVYNEKGESRAVQLNRHDFDLLMRRHRSENVILDLEVKGDAPRKVLVKEVQHNVLTGETLHADFLEISLTRKMRVGIPIRLVGDPVGVTAGGVLDQSLRDLEVECLPTDLVECITVDVSALAIGDSISVAMLKVDPKLHVVTGPGVSVASVLAPTLEEEAKPAEAVEGAEPELIKKPEKEGEGEEGEGEAKSAEGKGKPAEGKAKAAEGKGKPGEGEAKPKGKEGGKGKA
jgi:large subunit ribosomal protein L25